MQVKLPVVFRGGTKVYQELFWFQLSQLRNKFVVKGRMNKPNNMQDHFQSFNSALQTEVQRIEAMRKEVESREKALNDEKERMMKIEVEDDDVISLNIGGKIMAASRSTLCL